MGPDVTICVNSAPDFEQKPSAEMQQKVIDLVTS
jgi:hypothetical protein